MSNSKISNDRLINIFLGLARIDGVCGREKDVANYIVHFLNRLGLSTYEDNAKQYSGGNSGNIICTIGSGGDRVLLSHMDTARSTQNMKYVIQNGIIRSDGTTVLGVDNRAGIAILLYAVEFALQNKLPIRDCTLVFTICEESTMTGSRYLALKNDIKMGFVFDSAFAPGRFINGTCGIVGFTVNVYGKASHSGLAPEKGINSIQMAAKALSRIDVGRVNERTIINIGTIQGGSGINIVPEKTQVRGEIRIMDMRKAKDSLNSIKQSFECVTSTMGGSCDFEYSWGFKPYFVDKDYPTYREAVRANEQVQLTAQPVVAWSGSDANSLNEKNIPSVNFGIGANNPHSNDECIKIIDLIKSAEIALKLITST